MDSRARNIVRNIAAGGRKDGIRYLTDYGSVHTGNGIQYDDGLPDGELEIGQAGVCTLYGRIDDVHWRKDSEIRSLFWTGAMYRLTKAYHLDKVCRDTCNGFTEQIILERRHEESNSNNNSFDEQLSLDDMDENGAWSLNFLDQIPTIH